MKKLLVLVSALIAFVAIGSVVATAHPVEKKVATKVTINFTPGAVDLNDPYDPYDSYGQGKSKFSGKVKAKKRACKKGRTVVVKRKGGGKVGKTKSNKRGRWKVRVASPVPPGKYFAVAKKKKINHGRIVCKRGKSKAIKVP